MRLLSRPQKLLILLLLLLPVLLLLRVTVVVVAIIVIVFIRIAVPKSFEMLVCHAISWLFLS